MIIYVSSKKTFRVGKLSMQCSPRRGTTTGQRWNCRCMIHNYMYIHILIYVITIYRGKCYIHIHIWYHLLPPNNPLELPHQGYFRRISPVGKRDTSISWNKALFYCLNLDFCAWHPFSLVGSIQICDTSIYMYIYIHSQGASLASAFCSSKSCKLPLGVAALCWEWGLNTWEWIYDWSVVS